MGDIDSYIKFTSCMRRYINIITQEKRKGLQFFSSYNNHKNKFMYPKFSMIFSCPEGSPERTNPYSYLSREKVLFGVISNFVDLIKKKGAEKLINPYVVYRFDTGDCYVYLVDSSDTVRSISYIPYTLLSGSEDNHKILSKDNIIEKYDEFFGIANTAVDVVYKYLTEVEND